MITGLFMGWTDPLSGQWFPVKKMTWNDGKYYTVYLQGMRSAIAANPSQGTAVKAGLVDLYRVEVTNEIEVSFRTRMPVNRPFSDIVRLDRLGLSTDLAHFDPFEYVARSGGRCGSDPCDIFPEVTPDENGKYDFHFGIGLYEDLDISGYLHQIEIGDRLIVNAGVITHKGYVVGTTPGYISHLLHLYTESIDYLTVAKVNHDIYKFGKILCHVEVNSRKCVPFTEFDYEPLADILVSSK